MPTPKSNERVCAAHAFLRWRTRIPSDTLKPRANRCGDPCVSDTRRHRAHRPSRVHRLCRGRRIAGLVLAAHRVAARARRAMGCAGRGHALALPADALGKLSAHEGDFILRYLLPGIYPDSLTETLQTMFGIVVIVVNGLIYFLVVRRRVRSGCCSPSSSRPIGIGPHARHHVPVVGANASQRFSRHSETRESTLRAPLARGQRCAQLLAQRTARACRMRAAALSRSEADALPLASGADRAVDLELPLLDAGSISSSKAAKRLVQQDCTLLLRRGNFHDG